MNGEIFWIGASRNEANGFSWSDGRELSFTKWGKGEPVGDTDPNNKGCAKMDQDSYWGESQCLMIYGYVCQIPRALSNCVDMVESAKVPCQAGVGKCYDFCLPAFYKPVVNRIFRFLSKR